MVFRARKVLGTFEKRVPELEPFWAFDATLDWLTHKAKICVLLVHRHATPPKLASSPFVRANVLIS